MKNEEQLAAAQMAQLFGSELLHVQKSTIHGNRDALKMHPNQFLSKTSKTPDKKMQELMLKQIEAQAKVQCPTPIQRMEKTSDQTAPPETLDLLRKILKCSETIVELLQSRVDPK